MFRWVLLSFCLCLTLYMQMLELVAKVQLGLLVPQVLQVCKDQRVRLAQLVRQE